MKALAECKDGGRRPSHSSSSRVVAEILSVCKLLRISLSIFFNYIYDIDN